MQEEKVMFLWEKFEKEIVPSVQHDFLSRLRQASDNAFEPLVTLKLKSRLVCILLSIFLGGLSGGKFYAGQIRAAVVKLVVVILLNIVGSLVSILWVYGALLFSLPVAIWGLVDIFQANGLIVTYNTEKLFMAIRPFLPKVGA